MTASAASLPLLFKPLGLHEFFTSEHLLLSTEFLVPIATLPFSDGRSLVAKEDFQGSNCAPFSTENHPAVAGHTNSSCQREGEKGGRIQAHYATSYVLTLQYLVN